MFLAFRVSSRNTLLLINHQSTLLFHHNIYYHHIIMLLRTLSKFSFSTLVLAEHNHKAINSSLRKLLAAASKLNQPNHVLLVGKDLSSVVSSLKESVPSSALEKIITVESPSLQHYLSENYDKIIQQLINKYKYKNVIALSNTFGKDIIPRVAARFDTQAIGDVTEIQNQSTFVRPTYAGNAISKVESKSSVKFLTVRSTSFDEIAAGTSADTPVEKVQAPELPNKTSFVKSEQSDSSRPDLTSAKIVVSGGRGVKSKENFKLIEDLANALGAAVGASRAAVDAGYCANQMQVGQTGKIVAPQLYIAVGISGAVQHLAGMKDSKVIVAINTKNEEPIFEIANYGLIGDLFQVVPELTEKLKKLKQ